MPHIIIEYNEPSSININGLCERLHAVASSVEALPVGGLRVRAYPAAVALVGDGDDANKFIYITVRIGRGRSEAVRRDIGDRLFAALTEFTAQYYDAGKPLSLGLEIQEIEPDWTWKKNNIHKIIADKKDKNKDKNGDDTDV